ncbi:MAG: carboxypeptidase-like regulatory domain-containing protein, partial [Pyrinomonadaceae bacterium]
NTLNASAGRIGVVVNSPTPFLAGIRNVFKVRFRVLTDAPLGAASIAFTDNPTQRFVTLDNGTAGQATYTDGSVNVVGARLIRINSTTFPAAPGRGVLTIDMTALGGETGVSFSVQWDPTKFSISSASGTGTNPNPDVMLGSGIPAGCTTFTVNGTQAAQGRIGFDIACTTPFTAGTRQLLKLTYTVLAAALPGQVIPVIFTAQPINAGVTDASAANLAVSFQNGTVTIIGPSAAGVTVSGRVTTSSGQGLRNATVFITDSEGVRRTATTSSFGVYTFNDVEAGGNYVIGVSSKRYRFASRVINVSDSLSDVDFVGQD